MARSEKSGRAFLLLLFDAGWRDALRIGFNENFVCNIHRMLKRYTADKLSCSGVC
jgi:hypothetical protein